MKNYQNLLIAAIVSTEREAKYFDIACKRIEQAYTQGQLFPVSQVHQKQEILI